MLFAELTAGDYGVIIGAVGLVLSQLATLLFTYLAKRDQARRDQQAAVKVEAVRVQAKVSATATAEALSDIARVGQMTHDLCNSAMLEQKRIHAIKCEAAAKDNPSAVNIAEAKAAREIYEEHRVKQLKMEAKGDKP